MFRGSQAIARGLLTKNELRSSAWRSLFRDIYIDAQVPVSHRVRCTAAARWLIPEHAAIAGRAAAALYGATEVALDDPIDIIVPRGTRFGPVAGLRVHTSRMAPDDVTKRDGIAVTTPHRTCWDLARWLDVVEAVAVTDALMARRLVTVDSLREYALSRAGDRGWRRTLRVADLVDGGAESPQESRLRVRLVLAGLPKPWTQYVVSDENGRFVARLDLAWPEFKVGVEYDGVWHNDAEQFHRDRRRLNRLLTADWIVLYVTARRLREDFAGVVSEIRAALRSRRSLP